MHGAVAPQFSTEKKLFIMDTKFIKKWGEDILSYRHRTARAKKRAQYKDFHKHLIKLYKEERALRKQQRNLGWEPLTPPVQKGWKRSFVLRQDVKQSKQADFYAGILARINTKDWSHRKDFKVKKRAFGKKKYVVKDQGLITPGEYEFCKLAFTDEEQKLFYEVIYLDRKKRYVKKYVFAEPWRFVLKVQPNIIYKIRKRDAVIERRLQEIDSYLERTAYRGILNHLLYGSSYSWYWEDGIKYNEVNGFKNKPLQRILDEIKEEAY